MYKKIVTGVVSLFILSVQVCQAEPEKALQQQITELKAEQYRQHERIKHLEYLIEPASSNAKQKVVVDRFAWQQMLNWERVKIGMSRSQVESILGQPTNVKDIAGTYLKLLYQGEKAESGYISGNVTLDSTDRLVIIEKPVM